MRGRHDLGIGQVDTPPCPIAIHEQRELRVMRGVPVVQLWECKRTVERRIHERAAILGRAGGHREDTGHCSNAHWTCTGEDQHI